MRVAIAQVLTKAIIAIGVPCLIAAKLHVLPRRVNKLAMWGLLVCLLLIFVRLSLLAFGD